MPGVLFAGGRLDSLKSISGTPVEISTGGYFDSTYADCAVRVSGSDVFEASFVDSTDAPVDLVTGQTGYTHFEMVGDTGGGFSGNGVPAWSWHDAAGNPWIRVQTTTSSGGGSITAGLFYNSGTVGSPVWTQVGSNFTWPLGSRFSIDVKLTMGSPHTISIIYNNSTLLINALTFTQPLMTALRSFRGSGFYGGGFNNNYSQILVTEGRSAIGGKVKYSRANGAGANTGWTGAFGNVNEVINSDATVDTATSAGLRQTYAMGDVTIPAGYSIVAVAHCIRAKNDGASPANIKSSVRQGATNYDRATDYPGISTNFGPLVARHDVDPATGVSWTQAGFNSAEFGYLSVA